MTKVFVYGTLKKGYHNHYLLEDSIFLGEDKTYLSYVLLNCGFPYMCIEENQPDHIAYQVVGEVYEVSCPKVLADLDRLEGVRYNHYSRETIPTEKNGLVDAYIACETDMIYPSCIVEENSYVWRP